MSATDISLGGGSYNDVLTADLNGDGTLDLISVVDTYDCTSGNYTYQLSVALQTSNGAFGAPQLITGLVPANSGGTYYNAQGPWLYDVNGDGKLDIVYLVDSYNYSTYPYIYTTQAAYLPGNGDGTFGSSLTLANVSFPDTYGYSLAFIDVNGDGHDDIVMTGYPDYTGSGTGAVTAFISNGDGTFQAGTTLIPATYSYIYKAVDLNGDGKKDLVFYGSGTSAGNGDFTAINNGNGTFATPVTISSPNNCGFAFGDVNSDGKVDIVSSDCGNNTVSVLDGNGDGTFGAATSYFAGSYPDGVALGDMNGDGKLDIISANDDGGDVSVLLNKGDGTFNAATVGYAMGGYPFDPMVADIDGDGKMDVVVPDDVFSYVFLKGYGDGTLKAATDLFPAPVKNGSGNGTYSYGWNLVQADLNGDGKMDFVSPQCCYYGPMVNVYMSNGSGGYTITGYGDNSTLSSSYIYYAALGDLNGDGKLDIVLADDSQSIFVLLNNGDGTFAAPTQIFTNNYPYQMELADVTGDGKLDVVATSGNQFMILPGNGDGTFGTEVDIPTNSTYGSIDGFHVRDVNGDGHPDIVLTNDGDPSGLQVWLNDGAGNFTAQAEEAVPGVDYDFTFGDFNGDGKLDIATVSEYSYNGTNSNGDFVFSVLMGNGDGTFQAPVSYAETLQDVDLNNPYSYFITNGDMNGDGKPDLVYSNTEYGSVAIAYNVGDGTFYAPIESPVNSYNAGLVTTDVNGDGAPDVVVASDDSNVVTIALNAGGNAVTGGLSTSATAFGSPVAFTINVAATVKGVTAVPDGTFNVYDGTTLLGSSSVANGTGMFSTSALAVGAHTLTAVYEGGTNFAAGNSVTGSVTVSLVPAISSLSPAHVTAGSAAMTLTVNGSNFGSGAVVSFNGTALTTTVVSSTQLTASVPASALTTVGTANVTVQNPGTLGGTSGKEVFAIDTPSTQAGSFTATITTPATVNPGQAATYSVTVTFTGSATALTATCANLPTGATCSWNDSTKTLTVQTSASTPAGTYNITVIFTTATHAALWLTTALATLLPFGFFAAGKLRRRQMITLVVVGLLLTLAIAGCSSSFNTASVSQPAQGSSTATLTVI